jgi:hypothetical protein
VIFSLLRDNDTKHPYTRTESTDRQPPNAGRESTSVSGRRMIARDPQSNGESSTITGPLDERDHDSKTGRTRHGVLV